VLNPAAAETRRWPSTHQHDRADVVTLIEEHPILRTPESTARLREVGFSVLKDDFTD